MELAPTYEPAPLPDELLVIRNPVSANAQRAQHQIADLQGQFPFRSVDVYPTVHYSQAPHEENRRTNQQRVLDLLAERVDPNNTDPYSARCWLVLATGDGTIRDVAEAMLDADDAIRSVPLLLLPGGNGNDNSSMAHDFWGKHWPARHMDHAQIEPVHPLECSIEHADGAKEIRYALGYLSVGEIIAKTAKDIDQDRGRNRLVQLANEKILAIKSIMKAAPTTVVERGVKRQTGELIFSNGGRMAKFLHWDQQLSDPQFTRTEIPTKSAVQLAKSGLALAMGRHRGTVVPDGNVVQLQTASDSWIQLDGEAFPLPAESTVSVRRSLRSVHIVHLRRPEPSKIKAFAF